MTLSPFLIASANTPLRMFGSPLISVFKTLVIKRGFLDGVHGLIIAWATAHYHFLKYAKKWEKLRRRTAVTEVTEETQPLG